MTYGEVKKRALQLLDQYSSGGVLTSESDSNSKDYILRFPQLCDAAQMEIATAVQPLRSRLALSLGTIPNLLALLGGAEGVAQHLDVDLVDAVAMGARSWYFEADGAGITYIEEETATGVWTVLASVTTTGGAGFVAYRGLISPADPEHNVRLRHAGSYPYRVRNRALYGYTFATDADVPVFGPDVELTLPEGFWRMDKLLRDGTPVDYQPRGCNVISVAREQACDLDVHYFRYPTAIPVDENNAAANSYVFEVSEEAAAAIPHYLASKCLSNAQSAANELAEYQSKLANLSDEPKSRTGSVRNVFTAHGGARRRLN